MGWLKCGMDPNMAKEFVGAKGKIQIKNIDSDTLGYTWEWMGEEPTSWTLHQGVETEVDHGGFGKIKSSFKYTGPDECEMYEIFDKFGTIVSKQRFHEKGIDWDHISKEHGCSYVQRWTRV